MTPPAAARILPINQTTTSAAGFAATGSDLPAEIPLSLLVTDPELVHELVQWNSPADQADFALKALRIGILALKQARGNIDADSVRREGDRLLELMKTGLEDHSQRLNSKLADSLKEYFDPQSGRFQERVERLIKQDGELENVLRRQLSKEDSELARTLAHYFGQESPLMQMLSPTQSQGILAKLSLAMSTQLETQREHVLKQFSLDNKEGALFRFLGELTSRQGELSKELQNKIESVMKEFSFDKEDSALNKLITNMQAAQTLITREFSLDEQNSALARLKRELLLLLETQTDTNRRFQEEVKLALQEMVTRKKEAARSTRHGIEFEASLLDVIEADCQKLGDTCERTGNSTGLVKNSKKGDGVITLGPESAAPGARIVVEAKEVEGYTLTSAIAELEEARKNRGAQIGVFVFSSKTAPDSLEPITRRGPDLFIVWDSDDIETDLYLTLGLSVARALVIREQKQTQAQAADFESLDKTINSLEKDWQSLDDLKTAGETIGKQSEKILDRVRILQKNLLRHVERLRESTQELRATLGDGT